MFSLDLLRDLHQHMAWADARVWKAIARLPGGPQPDGRLRVLLLHLHTVQKAFLSVWTGEPVVFKNENDFGSLEELRSWADPYYAQDEVFLRRLSSGDLTKPLSLPWAAQIAERLGGSLHTPTLEDTIFQVTSHTTHHRGQVTMRLRELGVEPPLTDYIAWIWFGKPAPEKR